MRVEWELDGFQIPREEIAARFAPTAERLRMHWELRFFDLRQSKSRSWCSKHSHCLYDLMLRSASGELRGSIDLVISNHADLAIVVKSFGISCLSHRSGSKKE